MSNLRTQRQPGNANTGFLYANGTSDSTFVRARFGAAVDPGVNDDSVAGYTVGSSWFNTTANSQWTCFDATAGAAIWVQVNSGGSGSAIKETIALANTFAAGDIVRKTNTGYVKAQADSANNSEVLGVIETASGAQFTVTYEGKMTLAAHGFTIGDVLFLSAGTSGLLTATEPSTAGQVSKPVAIVLTANALLILKMRGFVIPSTITLPTDLYGTANVRVTPTSLTPFSGDSTAVTNLYVTPYMGAQIALYTGAAWVPRAFTEITVSLAGFAASSMFDLFLNWNGAAVVASTVVWTSITARASALGLQDGVQCLNSDKTKRLVCSFGTTAVIGQTEWSKANRLIWNMYNRRRTNFFKTDATTVWNYASGTFRQARATATNKITAAVGLAEDSFLGRVNVMVAGSGSPSVGIGINSTTVNSANITPSVGALGSTIQLSCDYADLLPIGLNSINWLEAGTGAGVNFYGTHGINANDVGGIIGSLDM